MNMILELIIYSVALKSWLLSMKPRELVFTWHLGAVMFFEDCGCLSHAASRVSASFWLHSETGFGLSACYLYKPA
jgi:hypothetical protein